jgi:hypothetical protein
MKELPNRNGYLRVHLSQNGKSKSCFVHRIIALTFIPNFENLPYIDHIDRNQTNNNVSNLRWATKSQNQLNRKFKPKNGFKGIRETHSGRYQSQIHNPETGKTEGLGTYDTKEEASQAYDKKAVEIHINSIAFLVLNNPVINNNNS